MSKIKVMFGFAMLLSVLAVSVSSASAFWEAENGKNTTGKGFAGSTTFGDEGASVTCAKAEGEWRIQNAAGASVSAGEFLQLNVLKWNSCTAFGFVGAEVKPCKLTLKSAKTVLTATGSVTSECIVIAKGNCELKVAAIAANEGLKEIKLANVGSNQEDKVAVTGVTSVATSLGGLGCVGVKNPKNTVGTETGIVTGEALKAV